MSVIIIIRENIDIMKYLLLTKATFKKKKYSKNSNILVVVIIEILFQFKIAFFLCAYLLKCNLFM